MSKLDDFKKFVSKHQEFVEYVKNNNTTWQSLYELYDIYGENEKVWEKYISKSTTESLNIKGLLNTLKNINLDSLQDNITSIQKAVGLVEELTRKGDENKTSPKKEENINRLYGEE